MVDVSLKLIFALPVLIFLSAMLPSRFGKGPFAKNGPTVNMLKTNSLFFLFCFIYLFTLYEIFEIVLENT